MPYRIQLFYPPPSYSDDPPLSELLPQQYEHLHHANAEARDLAEIEYCIPDVETAVCISGQGEDVAEVWTVGEIGRGFGMEGVRVVIRVVVVEEWG